MLQRNREKDPGQLDLKQFVEYTGKQDDSLVFQDPLAIITSEGIKPDSRLISNALIAMGLRVDEKKRKRLGHDDGHKQSMCYLGVKLRPSINPNMSLYVPKRDFPAFFNKEVAKKQYHHDDEIEYSDND